MLLQDVAILHSRAPRRYKVLYRRGPVVEIGLDRFSGHLILWGEERRHEQAVTN